MFLPIRTVAHSLLRLPQLSAAPSSPLQKSLFSTCQNLKSSSSSKPSNPSDNRPKTITTPATSNTATRKKSAFASRKTSLSSRVGGVVGLDVPEPRLPSVPNTKLGAADVAASSFFALHRPVSITDPIPKTYTESAFSAIFEPLSSDFKRRPMNVTAFGSSSGTSSPVSSAVDANFLFPDLNTLFSTIRQTGTRDAHGEYQEASIQLPSQLLSPNNYKPFHPPPPPVPFDDTPVVLAHNQLSTGPGQAKQYITIFQSTDLNGMTTLTARMSSPSPYMTRLRMGNKREMLRRQQMEESGNWAKEMIAISVKRQRKLKMKKHKYKKLMKKTRNLRRRLEKQ